MAVSDVLNANNELFNIYITWSGILLIKTFLISLLTVYHRRKNKVSNELCKDCRANLQLFVFIIRPWPTLKIVALEKVLK